MLFADHVHIKPDSVWYLLDPGEGDRKVVAIVSLRINWRLVTHLKRTPRMMMIITTIMQRVKIQH